MLNTYHTPKVPRSLYQNLSTIILSTRVTQRTFVRCIHSTLSALIICVLLSSNTTLMAQTTIKNPINKDRISLSLLKESKHSLKKGHEFLLSQQKTNGSWQDQAPVTAMVLYALILKPEASFYADEDTTAKAVAKGFAYLQTFVRKDGGIYQKAYRNYITSVCLMAFAESRNPDYKTIVTNARAFLIRIQLGEDQGFSEDHPYYGGIGYGGDTRPDLSNTQLALDAIYQADQYTKALQVNLPTDAEMKKDKDELEIHWKKALLFLNRCQNIQKYNKEEYASNDGGFQYETGDYKKERSKSYGSMTYAGVKSLVYANLQTPEMEEKVQAAFNWIQKNYTWEENPGFGNKALYYYYMTAAKCLDALKVTTINDRKKRTRYWRSDIISKLISIQYESGKWVNVNGRFWENVAELTTAYAMIAQKYALSQEVKSAQKK